MSLRLLHGLTEHQMREVYDSVLYDFAKDEIETAIYANEYLGKNPDVTEDEVVKMANILYEDVSEDNWEHYIETAIDYVIEQRPKEEPKSIIPSLYGLNWEQMKNVYDAVDKHFMRGEVVRASEDCFYDEKFTPEELDGATGFALAIRDDRVEYNDIARDAIQMVMDDRKPKEPPKDLLNDTLKMIGLETNQFFRINDNEFGGDDFYIDSFGDVYLVSGHPDMPEDRDPEMDKIDEYLTLGRILTQYPDKIVPWDIKDVGYA